MRCELRRLQTGDLPEVTDIYNAACRHREATQGIRAWRSAEINEFLFALRPSFVSHTCIRKGDVIGWTALTRHHVNEGVRQTAEMSLHVQGSSRRRSWVSACARSSTRNDYCHVSRGGVGPHESIISAGTATCVWKFITYRDLAEVSLRRSEPLESKVASLGNGLAGYLFGLRRNKSRRSTPLGCRRPTTFNRARATGAYLEPSQLSFEKPPNVIGVESPERCGFARNRFRMSRLDCVVLGADSPSGPR